MTQKISLKSETPKGYTLTLNAGGGTPIPAPLLLPEGAELPAVTAPTLEGYEFSGWSLDGEIIDLAAFKMPARDVTLTAVWSLLPSETRPPEANTAPAEPTVTDPAETSDSAEVPSGDPTEPAETAPPAKKGCKATVSLTTLLLPFLAALAVRRYGRKEWD